MMLGMLRSLWQYRHFVWSSIRNELKGRFVRSKLGGVWMIINPLAQVAIYALILSNVLAAKLPGVRGDNQYAYAVYLMAGLLAWTLFNDIVSRCLKLFIDRGNLMKKINFPRITLPTIVVGSCLLNNLLLFVAMMGVFALLGQQFSMAIFWLIPLTVVLVSLSLGLGLLLGVMNVFIRDIGHVVPIVLQMFFWFTPIVYPSSIIPEAYRHLLGFNPMFPIVEGYHQVLVYGNAPEWRSLGMIALISVLLLAASLLMFRRASAELVDVL